METLEPSSPPIRKIDCPTLMAAATPQLYLGNAFRVTSLHVEARPRDVKRQTERLQVMQSLGDGKAASASAYALRPPPDADTIRDALKRLNDPEQRIVDEFFWFWPLQAGQAETDTALQLMAKGEDVAALTSWAEVEGRKDEIGSIATHNLAVAFHLRALDGTLHQIEEKKRSQNGADETGDRIWWYWQAAAERWERVATDEGIGDRFRQHIERIDDPRVTSGLARRFQNALPEALDKINAELALRFAQKDQPTEAKKHLAYMHETNAGLDNVARTCDQVLKPVRERLQQRIEAALAERDRDPAKCVAAARQLGQAGVEAVRLYRIFEGNDSRMGRELSDEVVTAILNCEIPCLEKTKDRTGYLDSLTALKNSFAVSDEVADRLEKQYLIVFAAPVVEQLSTMIDVCDKMEKEKNASLSGRDSGLAVTAPGVQGLFGLLKLLHDREVPAVRLEDTKRVYIDTFVDNFAIVARRLGVVAYNLQDNLSFALTTLDFAASVATSAEWKKTISDDQAKLREIKTAHACHYCGKDAKESAAASLKLVKDVANGIEFIKFKIPRCTGCRSVHGLTFFLNFVAVALIIFGGFYFCSEVNSHLRGWPIWLVITGFVLVTVELCAFAHYRISLSIAKLNQIKRLHDITARPEIQNALSRGFDF